MLADENNEETVDDVEAGDETTEKEPIDGGENED